MPNETDQLRHDVAELRRELAELRAGIPVDQKGADAGRRRSVTSRRALLGLAAGATGAALTSGRPAAAAIGDPVLQGSINESKETTEIKYPGFGLLGGAQPRGHVFIAQDGVWPVKAPGGDLDPETGTRAAVAGWSGNETMNGMFGITTAGNKGASGGRFIGESPASYGAYLSGRRAALRLALRDGPQAAPPARGDFHNDGELATDDAHDLWWCSEAGSPGVWRRVAGSGTAGALVAIPPVRVFDSRLASTPSSSLLQAGERRLVKVSDSYDNTGSVLASDVVPIGATAVIVNVTAAGHSVGNYLTVVPGDVATTSTATVNWPAGGAAVGNATTVGVDSSRRVAIIVGPLGSTHVTLDVTGYYR